MSAVLSDSRSAALAAGVAVLVVLGGCSAVTGSTPTPHRGTGPDVPNSEHVRLTLGSSGYVNESGFSVPDGRVIYQFNADGQRRYEHVTVCLYDEEGTVLNGTDAGTLSSSTDSVTYAVSSDEIPAYVVPSHPGFRTDRPATVEHEVLEWRDPHYRTVSPEAIEFEYPRHDRVGSCP